MHERGTEVGKGKGGDTTLVIDRDAEAAIVVTLEEAHAAGMRFDLVSEELGTRSFDGDGPNLSDVRVAVLHHLGTGERVSAVRGEGVMVDAHMLAQGDVQMPFGRVAAGSMPAPDDHPRPPAGPVQVLLRPDDVIHDDDSPHTARVLRKAFRGAQILYTLELDGGVQALALVPSHHDHAIGSRIGIRIAADHVVAFAAAPP